MIVGAIELVILAIIIFFIVVIFIFLKSIKNNKKS